MPTVGEPNAPALCISRPTTFAENTLPAPTVRDGSTPPPFMTTIATPVVLPLRVLPLIVTCVPGSSRTLIPEELDATPVLSETVLFSNLSRHRRSRSQMHSLDELRVPYRYRCYL